MTISINRKPKKQKVANDQTNEMLRESDLHDLQNELAGLKEDLITHGGENSCSVFSESISMPKIDKQSTPGSETARENLPPVAKKGWVLARIRSAGQIRVTSTES